jgi:hypothetical protein
MSIPENDGAGLQPFFVFRCNVFLGRCPRLIWCAPSALGVPVHAGGCRKKSEGPGISSPRRIPQRFRSLGTKLADDMFRRQLYGCRHRQRQHPLRCGCQIQGRGNRGALSFQNRISEPEIGASYSELDQFLSRNTSNGRSVQGPKGLKRIAGGVSPRLGYCIKKSPSRGERQCLSRTFCRPSGAKRCYSIQPRA